MKRTERLASAYIGRRLELLRLDRGLTAERMAAKVGRATTNYRLRELGLHPISLDFLLRCHMVLGTDLLERVWFPVDLRSAAVNDFTIEVQIGLWEHDSQPLSEEQVIEVCAEAFGVPYGAIAGGLHHAKVRQARTAAALVVASRSHLRLTRLAPLVGRSRRCLYWNCRQAANDAELLHRVEQIQREVDSL